MTSLFASRRVGQDRVDFAFRGLGEQAPRGFGLDSQLLAGWCRGGLSSKDCAGGNAFPSRSHVEGPDARFVRDSSAQRTVRMFTTVSTPV